MRVGSFLSTFSACLRILIAACSEITPSLRKCSFRTSSRGSPSSPNTASGPSTSAAGASTPFVRLCGPGLEDDDEDGGGFLPLWARPLDPSIGVAGAKKSQVQKQQARVARSVAPKAMSSVLARVNDCL